MNEPVSLSLARLQMAVDKKQVDAKATLDEAALAKAGVVTNKRDGEGKSAGFDFF